MFEKVVDKFLFTASAIRLIFSSKGNLLHVTSCFFSGVNPIGRVHIHHIDTLTGNVKFDGWHPNLVTSSGRAWIADQISGRQKAPMSHMAVGTGTNAAQLTDTALQTEVDRNPLDDGYPEQQSGADANKVLFQCTWPAGDGTGPLTESGLFNSAAAGDMLCHSVYAVKNKEESDAIIQTWEMTISS